MEAVFLFLLISIRSQDSVVGTVTRLHAIPARVWSLPGARVFFCLQNNQTVCGVLIQCVWVGGGGVVFSQGLGSWGVKLTAYLYLVSRTKVQSKWSLELYLYCTNTHSWRVQELLCLYTTPALNKYWSKKYETTKLSVIIINLWRTKLYLTDLQTQFVPPSKHSVPRL
jgi:hypothetical protein